MTWLMGVAWICVAINLGSAVWIIRAARRYRRLNATLLALCVNSYLLRAWPAQRALGFVIKARPMTQAEWEAKQD